jgi:hypothetical protein
VLLDLFKSGFIDKVEFEKEKHILMQKLRGSRPNPPFRSARSSDPFPFSRRNAIRFGGRKQESERPR